MSMANQKTKPAPCIEYSQEELEVIKPLEGYKMWDFDTYKDHMLEMTSEVDSVP